MSATIGSAQEVASRSARPAEARAQKSLQSPVITASFRGVYGQRFAGEGLRVEYDVVRNFHDEIQPGSSAINPTNQTRLIAPHGTSTATK